VLSNNQVVDSSRLLKQIFSGFLSSESLYKHLDEEYKMLDEYYEKDESSGV
jgi:hypothetical protein